jgi:hypothetical protein
MSRAQHHVDKLAGFIVELLETVKPFRPYARRCPSYRATLPVISTLILSRCLRCSTGLNKTYGIK